MNKLVKMGAIGFGVFAFSEFCGIIGEAQALSALISTGKLEAEELYAEFDGLADMPEGYCKFKCKMIKELTSLMVEYYGE